MCTENHVCFGRIHGSQLREGANAGYMCTYHNGTMVRTRVYLVQWYTCTYSEYQWYHYGTILVPHRWYMCTTRYVHVYVHGVLEYQWYGIAHHVYVRSRGEENNTHNQSTTELPIVNQGKAHLD